MPSTSASYVRPVVTTVTRIDVAPSTTWWLVTTSPSLPITMPLPAASPAPNSMSLVMVTRPADCSAVASVVSRDAAARYGET